jgi:hypothetical protein
MTPHEELTAALEARTYDQGVDDGAFHELAHLHLYLQAILRTVGEAIAECETRMAHHRGRP